MVSIENDGACAALGKAVYVNTLEDLNAYVRVQGGEELYVPVHVKDFDASVRRERDVVLRRECNNNTVL